VLAITPRIRAQHTELKIWSSRIWVISDHQPSNFHRRSSIRVHCSLGNGMARSNQAIHHQVGITPRSTHWCAGLYVQAATENTRADSELQVSVRIDNEEAMSLIDVVIDLTSYVAGVGSVFSYSWLRNKLKKKFESNEPYSVKWLYGVSASGRTYGFRCPTCANRGKNNAQMPYCECMEFPRGHFHFKCNDCGYTVIMRTQNEGSHYA